MDIFNAAKTGNLQFISAFQAKGGDLNCRDPNGMTPLVLAVDANQEGAVQLLLSYRVDVNAVDKWGQTALMLAAGRTNDMCTRLLLEARADLKVRAKNGLTALGYATDNGSAESAKILKRAGAR